MCMAEFIAKSVTFTYTYKFSLFRSNFYLKMVQYLIEKFKICMQLVLFIIKESAYQCDKNLMLAQIFQNITFSLEAFRRLYVALIPISPASVCILAYIDSTLLPGRH